MVSRLSAPLSAGLLIVMSNAAVAESGIASIYPHPYKGRRTASGQP
jgi:rare lipoprotein A (peptidoglycan hydrolase)